MKLIVGLGNPGQTYLYSRHNAGFLVIRQLSRIYKAPLKKEKSLPALSSKVKIQGQNIILAMPLTFMNLSGIALSGLLKKYKISLDNLFVVCDDLDLAFGRMRVRAAGSAGGHRGLESIVNSLNSQEFARLRVGIGRPRPRQEAAEFVLGAFSKKEKEQLKDIIARAADCAQAWTSEGISKTMNTFNQRSNKNE